MLRAAVPIAATLLVLVLVVVASATAYGAKSSRPSQTTSGPLAGKKYISKRYSYEIVLQGTFVMIPAQVQWDAGFPFGSSGQVDIIIDRHDRKFIVAAKPVSSGMSLSQWEAFVVRLQRENCTRLRNFRPSSLGGAPAREFVNNCPRYTVTTLAALHGKRGYLLNYLSPPGFSAASARRVYEAGRHAFAFTRE
jgi:hypothetical protein